MWHVPVQIRRLLTAPSSLLKARPFSTTIPSTVPQLDAWNLSDSRNRSHVSQVCYFLKDVGILKVNLKFEDNDSHYLEQLILSLHQYHNHGLPIDHSASRGWFWDVRPVHADTLPATTATLSQDTERKTRHRARSETMNTFPWHTDCSYENSPPRFFALQVLYPDQCGGGILSLLQVERLLVRLSASAQRALSAPEYHIQVPPEFIKNDNRFSIIGPVLSTSQAMDGESHPRLKPQLRFREDIFTPLTERAKMAMEELKHLLLGSEIQMEVLYFTPELLPQESIILLDNRRWLHARSAVKDPNRHLRRVRWDARPFN